MTAHNVALVHQSFKSEFDSPDRVTLEEVVNNSQEFGFAVREPRLL